MNNLKLKAKKTALFVKELEFLGFLISENGVTYSEKRIQCIKNLPTPTTPKSLRSYLGMMNYFRKFCRQYSTIAAPLFKLAIADQKDFKWEELHQKAWEQLKTNLTTPPILALPAQDDKFILTTDSSDIAIGSILQVERPEGRRVIAYASHLLESSRRKYAATKKGAICSYILCTIFQNVFVRNRIYCRNGPCLFSVLIKI